MSKNPPLQQQQQQQQQPQLRSQTVVLLRHGVAQHNYRGADLTSPSLFDPSLTYEGKQGALQAGEKIKAWYQKRINTSLTSQSGSNSTSTSSNIDLIVCSPLTRTLQTASLAFLPGQDYNNPTGRPTPLLCVENVREAFGMHYPDKRRERSILEKHWPQARFDQSMPETDCYWSPTQRESWEDVGARIQAFLSWLCQRAETNIVVVSHGVWIETCLAMYSPGALGDRRVYNCDAYAATLLSQNGQVLRFNNVKLIR